MIALTGIWHHNYVMTGSSSKSIKLCLFIFSRLKFFSAPATAYIRQLFWSVAKQRQKLSQPNDKDLLNHLMKLKENLKLPVDTDTSKLNIKMSLYILQ